MAIFLHFSFFNQYQLDSFVSQVVLCLIFFFFSLILFNDSNFLDVDFAGSERNDARRVFDS